MISTFFLKEQKSKNWIGYSHLWRAKIIYFICTLKKNALLSQHYIGLIGQTWPARFHGHFIAKCIHRRSPWLAANSMRFSRSLLSTVIMETEAGSTKV